MRFFVFVYNDDDKVSPTVNCKGVFKEEKDARRIAQDFLATKYDNIEVYTISSSGVSTVPNSGRLVLVDRYR